MEKSTSSKPELFHCPTCGASLPVPDAPTVRCMYCGSNVLVPPEYRVQKPAGSGGHTPSVTSQVSGQVLAEESASPRRSAIGVVIFIVALTAICVVGGFALSTAGLFTTTALVNESIENITTQVSQPQNQTPPTMTTPMDTPTPTMIPPLSVDLVFGGEGSGAGKFDDPRYAAIDLDQNIFVADYMDGRVQKFDSNGKFLQLIQIEPDRNQNTIILDMVADYRGNLYIIRGGDILVYDASDGNLVRQIPGRFPDLSYRKLAVDLANNLYVINDVAPFKDLIKFDPDGNVLWEKSNFLEPIVPKNRPFNVQKIVADGVGNIFILNSTGYEVYNFDSQGNFLDRFGSQGKAEQQFSSPSDLAIDGTGRLYIFDSSNGYWLKAYDQSGGYLRSLPWPDDLSYPRTILFDAQGMLYTVTNSNQVGRMRLNSGGTDD